MVEELLHGIFGDLARALDFSTLRKMPASFVRGDLRQRHSDLLWRVDFLDRGLPPLLILLEFQSAPHPQMALRVLEYKVLALREAVKNGVAGPNGERPLFATIVFYNGIRRWIDRTDLSTTPVPADLVDYEAPRPYFLLDIRAGGASGLPPDNLVVGGGADRDTTVGGTVAAGGSQAASPESSARIPGSRTENLQLVRQGAGAPQVPRTPGLRTSWT